MGEVAGGAVSRARRGGSIWFSLTLTALLLGLTACSGSSSDGTFAVGGSASGLNGTVVLQNNDADDLSVTENGAFAFATTLPDGSPYQVSVKTQPTGQTCTVSNAAGTIAGEAISDVAVACSATAGSGDDGPGTVCGLEECFEDGIFVATAENGGDDGSMEAPLATLQAAIDKAAGLDLTGGLVEEGTGDRPAVHVSEGSYEVDTSVVLSEGVSVFGGYDVDFTERDPELHPTAIVDTRTSGGSEDVPIATVVAGTALTTQTLFDGFAVSAGDGSYTAALAILGGSPTISNNTFTGGTATESAHGILIVGGAAELTDNSVTIVGETGITIWSGTPTLTGNTISGATTGILIDWATFVVEGITQPAPTVSGNTISDIAGETTFGIRIVDGAGTISENVIDGGTADALNDGDSQGLVISGSLTGELTIADNIIDGGSGGLNTSGIRVLEVPADVVTISGNQILAGSSDERNIAVFIEDSGAVVVTDNAIDGGTGPFGNNGVSFFSSSGTVSNNTIYGGADTAGYSIGVYAEDSTVAVSGNTIHAGTSSSALYGYGIWAESDSTLTISGNTVHGGVASSGVAYGINVDSSTSTIRNNTVHGGVALASYGIQIGGGMATIQNNTIDSGDGSTERGIALTGSAPSVAIQNNIIISDLFCIDELKEATATALDNNDLYSCPTKYKDLVVETPTSYITVCASDGDVGNSDCSVKLGVGSGNVDADPALVEGGYFNQAVISVTGDSGAFTQDTTLTGQDSGATATIQDDSVAGQLTVVNVAGIFRPGEDVTDGSVTEAVVDAPTFQEIWQLGEACSVLDIFRAGKDLSTAFTEDKAGTTRTTSDGGWSIGAYEKESDPGTCN